MGGVKESLNDERLVACRHSVLHAKPMPCCAPALSIVCDLVDFAMVDTGEV